MAEDLTASPSLKANREFKNSVFTLLFNEGYIDRRCGGPVGGVRLKNTKKRFFDDFPARNVY